MTDRDYFLAIFREDVEAFAPLLLALGPNIIDPWMGMTALQCSVASATISIVKLLLGHPDLRVNQDTEKRVRPLLHACGLPWGDAGGGAGVEVVRLLLAHPACEVNGDGLGSRNMWEQRSKRKGARAYVEPSFGGWGGGGGGSSSIPGAVEGGNEEGEVPPHVANTPLLAAVYAGNTAIVKLLLTHPKIDPNFTPRAVIPLSYAIIRRQSLEMIEAFLAHPKIDVARQSRDGKCMSPMHHAVLRQDAIIIARVGAHPTMDMNAKNAKGNTPFNTATEQWIRDLLFEVNVRRLNIRIEPKMPHEQWWPVVQGGGDSLAWRSKA